MSSAEIIRNNVISLFEEQLNKFKARELTADDEWKFTEFFLRKKFLESEGELDLKYWALGWYLYEIMKIEDSIK